MTPEQAKALEASPIWQAFKEGKTIQALSSADGEWRDVLSIDVYRIGNSSMFRIKPEPRMVPLEAKDVPPGSVIKQAAAAPESLWRIVTSMFNGGVVAGGAGMLSFEELKSEWLIKRPGEDWQKCEKEAV